MIETGPCQHRSHSRDQRLIGSSIAILNIMRLGEFYSYPVKESVEIAGISEADLPVTILVFSKNIAA